MPTITKANVTRIYNDFTDSNLEIFDETELDGIFHIFLTRYLLMKNFRQDVQINRLIEKVNSLLPEGESVDED